MVEVQIVSGAVGPFSVANISPRSFQQMPVGEVRPRATTSTR